ncbi:cytochrome p450 [Moniliophthora roreri MCA 2997]|uniref:Cytochrome p450 n=2 Tax=Moniliophthora roreri TaxID=221103 RepID=V2XNW8_MONRO|nr:cytochrome p450 [Moniliophthora roreri MCA 2997]KAI3611417.1 cytochrome p450 [Moniliophthora roreri]
MDTVLLAILLGLSGWIISYLWSSSRAIPDVDGPPSPSVIFGHSSQVAKAPVGTLYKRWQELYGPTFLLKGRFRQSRLIINDPKGLNYVLQGRNFERNPGKKAALELFFGRGVFSAEGDEHRKMRKTLNRPFSNQSIQEISHVFFDLTNRLVRTWEEKLESNPNATFDVTIDVNRLALDAITMTMLSHDLNAENSDVGPLLARMMHSPPGGGIELLLRGLGALFPAVLKMPSSMKSYTDNLRSALGAIARDAWSGREVTGTHAKLLHALAEDNVSEDETIAQIITVIFAGSETTANVITECLWELAKNQSIQKKLRTELLDFEATSGRKPTYEDLNGSTTLPYLDAVTRETLRTKAVLRSVTRVVVQDDVIPLYNPIKRKSTGVEVYEVVVKAGTTLEIPLRDGINVSKAIWGEDAASFRPERWLDPTGLPETVKLVRAQGHVLSFGDGPKVCLGRSFAIAEFKIVLSHIIRSFSFEEVVGVQFDFYHVGQTTIKPVIRGREDEGTQLPLKVSLAS